MFRSAFSPILLLGTALFLSGCNEDPVDPDELDRYVWEARDVQPNGASNLAFSGDGFIDAVGGIVDTGIRLTDAEPGTQYGWLIRSGTCGSDGDVLSNHPSAFPGFVVNGSGVGQIAYRLSGYLEGTEQFYLEIYELDLVDEPLLVGCGSMALVAL